VDFFGQRTLRYCQLNSKTEDSSVVSKEVLTLPEEGSNSFLNIFHSSAPSASGNSSLVFGWVLSDEACEFNNIN